MVNLRLKNLKLIIVLVLFQLRVTQLPEGIELLQKYVALLLDLALEALDDLSLFSLKLFVPLEEALDTSDKILRFFLIVVF